MHRFVVALGRLAPPSLRQWLRRTRFGQAIARIIDEEGSYEPDVLRALGALVRPGETCADVGAHRGVITRQLARLVGPNGRVIAFEAHPDNARELERALAAEDLGERVRVENLAVTDGSRTPVPLHAGRRRADLQRSCRRRWEEYIRPVGFFSKFDLHVGARLAQPAAT